MCAEWGQSGTEWGRVEIINNHLCRRRAHVLHRVQTVSLANKRIDTEMRRLWTVSLDFDASGCGRGLMNPTMVVF